MTLNGQVSSLGWAWRVQAKELLDHLEGVLSSEPVEVVPGNSIVEVKPQGVSKGGAVERILLEAANSNTAHDVVVCIGDDRSDEDMYTAIEHVAVMPHMPAEVRCAAHRPCIPSVTVPLRGRLGRVPRAPCLIRDAWCHARPDRRSHAQVFACTVGQKPSKAPFYVNDPAEVLSILGRLIAPASTSPRS